MGLGRDLVSDKRGVAAAEYALILAVIGSSLALASLTLGTQIGNSLERAGTAVDEAIGSGGGGSGNGGNGNGNGGNGNGGAGSGNGNGNGNGKK